MRTSGFGDEEGRVPSPHPRFAGHFTDPIYDGSGEAGDVLPFGTDWGSDEIRSWLDYATAQTAPVSVGFVLTNGEPPGSPLPPLDEILPDPEYQDQVIVAAFVLLYYTGQIDPEGLELTLAVLQHRAATDGDPVDAVMLRDLETFAGFPVTRQPDPSRPMWFGIDTAKTMHPGHR